MCDYLRFMDEETGTNMLNKLLKITHLGSDTVFVKTSSSFLSPYAFP